ncbi:3-hydroxybutyrate oligomer hydrolase family protein [Pseudoxanthomonas sacheonensis]|uniref:Hydroxybutyrate-dimer hydrolase n=1 Tax=Pseudoxanthomonas sacheonensis TaxID=443615 RepID=A0ABU1RNU3_9GAMM|nr:3-hydroxybutyrate oligomer hydrolase family protein [Pseudoxanthomonas sacheonensis]MDR6840448.1 hydroxybutyrate-dimer hydrolase [Pseudoxanthomonas sacheonensis]
MTSRLPYLLFALVAAAASGSAAQRNAAKESVLIEPQRITEHRNGDDLLTAGLGLDGLRGMVAPAFADPDHPTPAELRRRAIWNNWRGIADLSPGGGYGQAYGSVADVPGREFAAFAKLEGASQPHRVLLQVPDSFDLEKRCVVVTASSGSRGIYGSIAVAGAWGLPKGCAVAYTDKGAGTDYYDLDTRTGVRLDGTRGQSDEERLAFVPEVSGTSSGVAFKHAHSTDNPEADWGRHVKQAAEFALSALGRAYPQARPFTFANTRVIAVGISNGGGAVLRAAELEGSGADKDWLDAVVAGEPNVYMPSNGGTTLYDVTTEAALLMPCALLHLPVESLPQPPLRAQAEPLWTARCAALKTAGLVEGAEAKAQAKSAYDQLRSRGWTDQALTAGALSVGFDLWRAVAVTYASAYSGAGAGGHPCGYSFSAQNADFSPRAATSAERQAWWSDGSGIPPGAGVGIIDSKLAAPDLTLPGLQCLRALLDQPDDSAFKKGLAATAASLPRKGLPVVVIHGTDDGLVPQAFTSAPYVAASKAAGRDVSYWQVKHAQHFDGFLALPAYGARYVALLPYVYAALDQVSAQLDGKGKKPTDAVIEPTPRGAGTVDKGQFAIPVQP